MAGCYEKYWHASLYEHYFPQGRPLGIHPSADTLMARPCGMIKLAAPIRSERLQNYLSIYLNAKEIDYVN